MGITLTLEAKPFGRHIDGLDKENLINFYKKNGFETDMTSFGGDFETEEENQIVENQIIKLEKLTEVLKMNIEHVTAEELISKLIQLTISSYQQYQLYLDFPFLK